MTAPRHAFTIQSAGENSMARYVRCSRGKHGGEPVTVRIGRQGVMCCLTDTADRNCPHIRAVREWLEDGHGGSFGVGERRGVAA